MAMSSAALLCAFEDSVLYEMAMPFCAVVSWREPRLTQMPRVTERSPGIYSVKIVRPLESFVD
jgi:hypothetical protein